MFLKNVLKDSIWEDDGGETVGTSDAPDVERDEMIDTPIVGGGAYGLKDDWKNGLTGSVDDGSVDGGSVDGGSVDDGSVDDGSVDDGSVDDGSVDDGSVDNGSVDDGSVDVSAMGVAG